MLSVDDQIFLNTNDNSCLEVQMITLVLNKWATLFTWEQMIIPLRKNDYFFKNYANDHFSQLCWLWCRWSFLTFQGQMVIIHLYAYDHLCSYVYTWLFLLQEIMFFLLVDDFKYSTYGNKKVLEYQLFLIILLSSKSFNKCSCSLNHFWFNNLPLLTMKNTYDFWTSCQ